MPVHGCTFPGNTVVTDATYGWDSIYALKYSTINRHLRNGHKWSNIDFGGGGGSITTVVKLSQLSAAFDNIEIVRGGFGQQARFVLTLKDCIYEDFSGSIPYASDPFLLKLVLGIEVNVTSDPSPVEGMTGLMRVRFNIDKLPAVLQLQAEMNDQSSKKRYDVLDLNELTTNFLGSATFKNFLKDDIAEIYTNDYARTANIPWSTESKFQCVVQDMIEPDDDGVLAILGSVEGKINKLSPQLDPRAIPTDRMVDAVVMINARWATEMTLVAALNDQLHGSLIGLLRFEPNSRAIVNSQALNMQYTQTSDGGFHLSEVSDFSTTDYQSRQVIVEPGDLRFRLNSDNLSVEFTPARVKLDGYDMNIFITYKFQIFSVGDDIDLDLANPPEIHVQTDTRLQDNQTKSIAEAASIFASILVSEVIAFGIDKFMNISDFTTSDDKIKRLSNDLIAAREEALKNDKSVSFSAGFLRKIVVSKETEGNFGPAYDNVGLTDLHRNAIKLPTTEEFLLARTSTQNVNMEIGVLDGISMQNMSSEIPLEASDVSRPIDGAPAGGAGAINKLTDANRRRLRLDNNINVLEGFSEMASRGEVPTENIEVISLEDNDQSVSKQDLVPSRSESEPSEGLIYRRKIVRRNIELVEIRDTPQQIEEVGLGHRIEDDAIYIENVNLGGMLAPRSRNRQRVQPTRTITQHARGRSIGAEVGPAAVETHARVQPTQIEQACITTRQRLARAAGETFGLTEKGVIERQKAFGDVIVSEIKRERGKNLSEDAVEYLDNFSQIITERNARGVPLDQANAAIRYKRIETADVVDLDTIDARSRCEIYESLRNITDILYEKDLITATEYYTLVDDLRRQANLESHLTSGMGIRVYANSDGKLVELPRGLIREFAAQASAQPGYNMAIARLIVQSVKQPPLAKAIAIGLYLSGLIAGSYAGNWAQGLVSKEFDKKSDRDAEDAETFTQQRLDKSIKFLDTVRFPILSRRGGDANAPSPSASLRCAAINGGIILGLTIADL